MSEKRIYQAEQRNEGHKVKATCGTILVLRQRRKGRGDIKTGSWSDSRVITSRKNTRKEVALQPRT